eukprot:591404-Hanusia_phi.AAC.1
MFHWGPTEGHGQQKGTHQGHGVVVRYAFVSPRGGVCKRPPVGQHICAGKRGSRVGGWSTAVWDKALGS